MFVNDSPAVTSDRLILNESYDQIFRAIVDSFDDDEVFVRRDAACAVEGPYPRFDGVDLEVGDEVIVQRSGTGYLISSRLVRNGITSRSQTFWDVYVQTIYQGFVLGGPIG